LRRLPLRSRRNVLLRSLDRCPYCYRPLLVGIRGSIFRVEVPHQLLKLARVRHRLRDALDDGHEANPPE